MIDIVKNILNFKKQRKINAHEEFVPYVIQRWVSFSLSENDIIKLNSEINMNSELFNDKQRFHDTCLTLLPKVKSNYFPYIKNKKNDKKKEDDVTLLANLLEISVKNLQEYIKIDPTIWEKFESSQSAYKKG